jgi:hypothetical protein
MLSRISLAIASGLTFAFAATGVANSASDATEVGVGTAIVVLALLAFLTAVYGVKWYFGATEPPPLPPGGLPYHSLPAGEDGHHGHDAHGHH